MTTKDKAVDAVKKPAAKAKGFALINGAAEINKAITSIGNRASKLDSDVHRAAVSVVFHSAKHNDPDVAKRLVNAMGKTMRKQALIGWLVNYGAFTLDEAGELVYNKTRAEQAMSEGNIHAAIAEPFWEFTPEPQYRQFDLNAAIASLLKKAESALTNEKQDTALVQPDKLAALRAIAAASADSEIAATSAE